MAKVPRSLEKIMSIDIYATWKGQTEREQETQIVASGFPVEYGQTGCLQESEATRLLVREAFDSPNGKAKISSAVLRQRLPETLKLIRERKMTRHPETNEYFMFRIMKDFVDFMVLCQQKEFETGEPVTIIASY